MTDTTYRCTYPSAADLDSADVVSGWQGALYLIPGDGSEPPEVYAWSTIGSGWWTGYRDAIEITSRRPNMVGSEVLACLRSMDADMAEAAEEWRDADADDRECIRDRIRDAWESATSGVGLDYWQAEEWVEEEGS